MKNEDPRDFPAAQPVGVPPASSGPDAPKPLERLFSILSGVFFGLAVAVLLVIIYINSADELTVSPYLSPILFLLFGFGIGLGTLFRTVRNREKNVSPINFFFKIAFSVLILLTVLLTFLLNMLRILRQ